MEQPQFKIIEYQVEGIRCTSCSKKIIKNLTNFKSVKQINVNILAEKVLVQLADGQDNQSVAEKLNQLHFKVIGEPKEMQLEQSGDKRTVFFTLNNYQQNEQAIINLLQELQKVPGIIKINQHQIQVQDQLKLDILYHFEVIKGRKIYDQIAQANLPFSVVNPHLDNFKPKPVRSGDTTIKDVMIALTLFILFFTFTILLPFLIDSNQFLIYPKQMNIFSLYYIGMAILMLYTLQKFGLKIFINAWQNWIEHRLLNMETLITLGSLSAFFMSVYLSILYAVQNSSEDKFDEDQRVMQVGMVVDMMQTAALILSIITLGKYLETKSKGAILSMTQKIFPANQLLSNTTMKQIDIKDKNFNIDKEQEYDISLLDVGDLVRIEAPMRLLVDGTILHIEDQLIVVDSVCYGWDDPFQAKNGEKLKSGAQIKKGSAIFQIQSSVESSMLCKISQQLNLAQNNSEGGNTGISLLFKKFAEHFVKGVILIALIVLVIWIILIMTSAVDVEQFCTWCYPFERAISILVASCPCALGLAIPSVIVITLNLAMEKGILIKSNVVFEKIQKVGAVIFDKTGTLFTKVEQISGTFIPDHPEQRQQHQNNDDTIVEKKENLTVQELWEIIFLLEKEVKHPLAELLYQEAIKMISDQSLKQGNFTMIQPVTALRKGLQGQLHHKRLDRDLTCYIGSKKLTEELNIQVSNVTNEKINQAELLGQTSLLLIVNDIIEMVIFLDNQSNLRPEAKQVIHFLQKDLQKKVYILSGDSKQTVFKVGAFLNIRESNMFGETDAENKMVIIKQIKMKVNKEAMMIGDGLNDILSLQEAGVGISINAKSELNLMASDVVILNENLWKIGYLFNLMKYSRRFIIANLIWAFAYNIIMAPLAAGVFYSFDIQISPIVSSAAMSGSSLFVVLFSNFLRCINLESREMKEVMENIQFVDDIQERKALNNQENANYTAINIKKDALLNSSINDDRQDLNKGLLEKQ